MHSRPRSTDGCQVCRALSVAQLIFLFLGTALLNGCSRQDEAVPAGGRNNPGSEQAPAKAAVTSGIMRPASREDEFPSIDASKDEWKTEAFAERIHNELKRLGAYFSGGLGEVRDLAVEGIRFQPLIPEELETVYEYEGIRVRRSSAQKTEWQQGRHKFTGELRKLRQNLTIAGETRVRFKLVNIESSSNSARTLAYCEMHSKKSSVRRQLNSIWHTEWTLEPLALKSIRTSEFREATNKNGQAIFADKTSEILHGVPRVRNNLKHGIDYWQGQIEKRNHIFRFGHHGLALGDIDNDGRDDLYLPQPGGMPNLLLRQTGDGSVEDISENSGVNLNDMTRSALIVDLNNDSNQDLVVNTVGRLLFYSGDGTGRFKLKFATEDGRAGYSMAAADYDADGDLDVFVCSYSPTIQQQSRFPYPVPYHDANNGGANFLIGNSGDWKFSDVTTVAGLNADNRRFSFAVAWEDFDNDGDQDFYVANDYGRNNLFRNDAGKFTDVATNTRVEDIASGMSVSWGDANRDGYPDIYVGNMFSAAGNRIAYQRRFHADHAKARHDLQRFARGNSLFLSDEGRSFDDNSEDSGVTMGRWAWSSVFADINNDGWEDLLVANGYITGARDDDL